ncbi:pyridoxal-phosphate dependent enzyme [Amycolatopsis acidiphila]|uniref:threonine ammonia-lyase n=1 Tax=Amycolatopsis acidiphila TaxID=715473 RepID=A0A558AFX0_9PSEU|nr:pyridoxal-phosphate dependent enzyme [Amycolatopsis acidiphila]TVT23165.1 pyridoxal-phosphate dependent enzyme [Amycolatopsis acidiphila]UIJ60143.1 pyridoxal-phosphate dependent enzyme [Amycolatopsis acidiphila]GHG61110.1 serine/threonine dehydratase [Amycolatopsis acidiphila]
MNLEDIRAAAGRLAGKAHRTPIVTSHTLDSRVGAQVLLKCENFQRTGAFKFRGAYNALSQLSGEQLGRGVCTYSSGNHAQAVALAASLLGTKATILMPEDAPQSKVDAVIGYGAEVRRFDRYTADRTALAAELAAQYGYSNIPPYEHPDIMAGQGTAALEFLEEAGPVDVLLAPLGGGGLMAGTAVAASSLHPDVQIIGVEPAAGNDHQRSFAEGRRVRIDVPRTIADGLAVNEPGEQTFAINHKLVSEVVTVTDDEIRDAMRFLFDRMKLVVEPSGATVAAALLTGRVRAPGKRVGLIISGGNVSADRFRELLG